ncbi:MAG TPA: heme ABC exporter ATP-binding protein CcmA [Acidobacteriaceae bacterium]|jgi:heme ABC exporter ATP-binding subunit CcmA
MSAAVATIEDVSKLYGRFAALRHVSVTLEPGRCYLLLGENGAGKSTLLRVIAGLLQPTLGMIRVLDQTPAEARARIGYMSHAAMLYDELTACENLEYTAKLYSDRRCLSPDEALRMVELDPALARPVAQYSQGMRQRTSLARVLVSQPDLLLLDEPFSNMDRASAERMLALLAELRGAGRTIVLTTHQRELAEPMADAVLMMQCGVLTTAETA